MATANDDSGNHDLFHRLCGNTHSAPVVHGRPRARHRAARHTGTARHRAPCYGCLMRALVVTQPRGASVQEVPDPVPVPGQLLVEVERVGICGTDVELYTGEMAYIEQRHTSFP